MIVGLLLRFANAIHENSKVDLLCECVPMMVFMLCFFGFMDYMILYKWVNAMDNPPSIINSMIAMAMWGEDTNPMLGATLPKVLMAVCMLSVPCMLIPKPLVKYLQHRHRQSHSYAQIGAVPLGRATGFGSEDVRRGFGGGSPLGDEEACQVAFLEEEEFDVSEMCIHQVIETIEYVLGTVSHTASYLRLWALSLAHQQLSVVFFSMTILSGMAAPFPLNMILIYFWFGVWFAITVGILLGMDVLECFLHVLRLHWVEFQSKFFRADGYAFEPYCHKALLEKSGED